MVMSASCLYIFMFITIFNTGFMYLGIYNYKQEKTVDSIIFISVSTIVYLYLLIYLWYLYFKTKPNYYRNINIAYESDDETLNL